MIKDDFDVGKNKKKTGLENLENESNLDRFGSATEEDENEEETIYQRNIEKEIEFENPEIPTPTEMFWNFFLTPIILYTGFGRVVMLYERKNSLLPVA